MTWWIKGIIALVAVAAVVGSITAGYLFITGMQDKIATLERDNGTLKTAVKTQEETIESVQKQAETNVQNYKLMQNAIRNLQGQYDKSQGELADLRRKYARPVIRRGTDGKSTTGAAAPITGGYDDINRLLEDAARARN